MLATTIATGTAAPRARNEEAHYTRRGTQYSPGPHAASGRSRGNARRNLNQAFDAADGEAAEERTQTAGQKTLKILGYTLAAVFLVGTTVVSTLYATNPHVRNQINALGHSIYGTLNSQSPADSAGSLTAALKSNLTVLNENVRQLNEMCAQPEHTETCSSDHFKGLYTKLYSDIKAAQASLAEIANSQNTPPQE